MFHHFGTVTNTSGDSLPNWQVECVQLADGSTVVPIFADENSTPILTVSGVANRAKSDDRGNYDFFVPSGTYSLKFYNEKGEFQWNQRYLPMYGDVAEEDIATLTGLKNDTQALADQVDADATQVAADKVTVAADKVTTEGYKTTTETARDAAIAARDAAIAGANIYADTTAGLAATTSGDYFQIISTVDYGYVDLYLNSGGSAVFVDSLPNLEAVTAATARTGFVALEARNGAWWGRTRVADWAVDLTYGDGVGYNATAGSLDNMVDLVSGTLLPAADGTRKVTETTVSTPGGDYPGAAFAGSGTTRAYRGQIATLPLLRTGYSLHAVFEIASAASGVYRLITMSRDGVATITQRVDFQYASQQVQVGLHASGLTSKTDASGNPLASALTADGDIAIVSVFFDGSTVSYYVNGDFAGNLSQSLDVSAFTAADLVQDFVTIGGLDGGTAGVLPGDFLCAAQFSGVGHDRAEVRQIHRDLLDRFHPDKVENVFSLRWVSQSNGDTVSDGTGVPTFTKAYKWTDSSGSGYFTTSGVVPTAGASKSGNAGLWMAQEIVDQFAAQGVTAVPIVNLITSGGVPWSSSALWTSGSFYLGVEDEEGDRLGKTSNFATVRPFLRAAADGISFTPKFNVMMRLFVGQGFESDMSVGVPTNKTQQTIADTCRALEHEFGFTHFAWFEPNSRGANSTDSAANEPNAEKVRQAVRNFCYSHPRAYMVFDHAKDNAAAWSPSGTWSADNLTTDGDGKWTEGAAYDDGVHWPGKMSKAGGLKAGENFMRLLNFDFESYAEKVAL